MSYKRKTPTVLQFVGTFIITELEQCHKSNFAIIYFQNYIFNIKINSLKTIPSPPRFGWFY